MTTRRSFLGGVAGAFVAAVVGVKPKPEGLFRVVKTDKQILPESIEILEVPPVKPLPAWSVGDGGEMNWKVIFAETEEEAIKEWWAETHGEDPDEACDCGNEDCGGTLFACRHAFEDWSYHHPERAERSPHFDNPHNAEPSHADCFKAGWTVICDRCGNECSPEDCESAVIAIEEPHRDGDVVCCYDCMTDDELRKIRPDHYRFDEEEDDADDKDEENLDTI